jgi:carbamoyl-phosphate synthase large subunit
MPLNPKLRKVMVIGSGPIVIGQAAEFDYAGTQACRALKEEGLEVVLVNSNPATIMTDNAMADHIYIEPLTLETVKRVIKQEKPDSILSTLGGQTGLTLSMELAKCGFLEENNVTLLGANPETIDKAEDRQMFKDTMLEIGQPTIPSKVVTTLPDALAFAEEIGYPVIVRPAFTLGGTGGGICECREDLERIGEAGLRLSPITQILVERCIAGWKEIEFEVMRDSAGNVITVCSMENFDPVGIHTGDSIVIAPTVTLADKEYQMLRSAALNIITAMGIEGGCNCQFALKPDSFEYAVIEVNPRVSRSSALASKATGYPIARVAAKIAIGYTLDEIPNAVTGKTYACFEPTLDYVVVKLPKWPFDKFVYARRTLGTQMKATGEVMAIGQSFEQGIMKAVRGAAIGLDCLRQKKQEQRPDDELAAQLHQQDDERLFVIFEALRRGVTCEEIHNITMIDMWFLKKLEHLVSIEKRLETEEPSRELYLYAKKFGYPDKVIERISGKPLPCHIPAVFKMVDTCGAEFNAETPYFYSTYDEENEASAFIAEKNDARRTVIVFGSGPIRIGQGIEFDYASVHCVWSLRALGYQVVIVNNNPETVSTDFNTADRLYFEPLTPEDVMNVVETEHPYGVVVAFGGQTAINLTKFLESQGVKILGTSADSIDMAEDRERFDELLETLHIERPAGHTVMTCDEALKAANSLGYPVLMRPSYVLGGQNMIIAFNDDDIREYMAIILSHNIENPILIDKYLMGTELEVDAICDGEDILIPGIMEHIERAGIHSGDSIAVYPAWNIDGRNTDDLIAHTKNLALGLNTRGLVNIQYVIYEHRIYVIEVNPRASRTIPYISKVTGVPMVDLATRTMLGERLRDLGYGTGLYRTPPYVACKVPVFSFEKLTNVDVALGPEMKSTGEVLGIGKNLEEALFKGLVAAGYEMNREGGILVTVRDSDKHEIVDIVRRYYELGFTLYATEGTAKALEAVGLPVTRVSKVSDGRSNSTLEVMESGKISYVISTDSKGRLPQLDSVQMRRKAVELGIPCLTALDTANALAGSLLSRYTQNSTELVDLNHMRKTPMKLHFTKMEGTGNDYIYFDCMESTLTSPESVSVILSDRRFSIGGDGIILILPSTRADARMQMFNRDGSEGKMCGNGIRCVAKYLYEHNIVHKSRMNIETASGIRELHLYEQNGKVSSVTVNMGPAILDPKKIPVALDGSSVVARKVFIGKNEYSVTCVSVGNPHCVVFMDNVDTLKVEKVGPEFETDDIFPEHVNTEFVQAINRTTLKMRVWERGSGETFACGTGACAAVVAAVLNGFCQKNRDVNVLLRGGMVTVKYTDEAVYLTGDAKLVFEGDVEL